MLCYNLYMGIDDTAITNHCFWPLSIHPPICGIGDIDLYANILSINGMCDLDLYTNVYMVPMTLANISRYIWHIQPWSMYASIYMAHMTLVYVIVPSYMWHLHHNIHVPKVGLEQSIYSTRRQRSGHLSFRISLFSHMTGCCCGISERRTTPVFTGRVRVSSASCKYFVRPRPKQERQQDCTGQLLYPTDRCII